MSKPTNNLPTREEPDIDPRERVQQFNRAARNIARALRPYVSAYRSLERKLRSEGFQVRVTTLMAPIQLEGHLPTDERFYFRCRYDTCSLRIAPQRGDPVSNPGWRQEVSRWGMDEAGSLEVEEAEAVLRELLRLYQSSQENGGTSQASPLK